MKKHSDRSIAREFLSGLSEDALRSYSGKSLATELGIALGSAKAELGNARKAQSVVVPGNPSLKYIEVDGIVLRRVRRGEMLKEGALYYKSGYGFISQKEIQGLSLAASISRKKLELEDNGIDDMPREFWELYEAMRDGDDVGEDEESAYELLVGKSAEQIEAMYERHYEERFNLLISADYIAII